MESKYQLQNYSYLRGAENKNPDMKHNNIVIMAGGVGSRLFPISTPEKPKQFLDLLDCGETMIQSTYNRFLAADPQASVWVVTSEKYIQFVREQLPMIPVDQILTEPVGRGTASCAAYACWKIRKANPESVITFTPSDAYLPDTVGFKKTFLEMTGFLESRKGVVCIGIRPTEPNTNYGYIQAPAAQGVVRVNNFKEKPNLETAKLYCAEGCYFWNAGIFSWDASSLEKEIRRFLPATAAIMDELRPSFLTVTEASEVDRLFPSCENISIDYAIMEKTDCAYMAQGRWEWNDLGTLSALEAAKKKIQK